MSCPDLSCRLYILSGGALGEMQRRAASILNVDYDYGLMKDSSLYASIKRNNDFSEAKLGEYGGFVYYPYTAEVDPVDEIVPNAPKANVENFLADLCKLIVELRSTGCFVVASCSYEGVIAERTGWNWSKETPNHPVASVGET